jgi:DNA adenine methylase
VRATEAQSSDSMVVQRPFLRWAGSKRQLVGELGRYWSDEFDRYVEPFAGSACLFFHIQPRAALLGDSNAALINTYVQLRDQAEEVISELRAIPLGSESYYEVRAAESDGASPALLAARFIYLNRFCFNGIYRTNKAGRFNVPYGGEKSGSLPGDPELRSISRLLSRAKFVSSDFTGTLAHCKAGDFVYLDPPYHSSQARVFSDYTADGFSHKDVVRLRECLRSLDKNGISFALSYADNAEGELLAAGFRKDKLAVRRNVAGFTGNRRMAKEILVTNI